MMVCLDDCPPNEFSFLQMEEAIKRTVAWAKRCKREYLKQIKKRKISQSKRPLLFSVVQGGPYLDLRKKCAQELIKIGFDGYGFGARPVDKEGNFLEEVIRETAKMIPRESLRFALGVGTPDDIERCASLGWDMFDCVIPTREGRHGKLFQEKRNKHSSFNISNSKFSKKYQGINMGSRLPELRNHSLAYLHHLFKLKESLGQRLASLNNLEYYQKLMASLRK
jgi:queuine tRNA-ribosyltransferase